MTKDNKYILSVIVLAIGSFMNLVPVSFVQGIGGVMMVISFVFLVANLK